jgi:nucleoside-diphosphate-sugar epimerase
MFKTIWNGMKFYTNGINGFIDVKDVVRAMILLMDETNFEAAKNQRYLLNAENLSYQSVFRQIADALGKPVPKIHASGFVLKLAWRFARAGSWITGKTPSITRNVVASSIAVNNYDGTKIVRQFNFEYLPVSESIKQTAEFLKSEKRLNFS